MTLSTPPGGVTHPSAHELERGNFRYWNERPIKGPCTPAYKPTYVKTGFPGPYCSGWNVPFNSGDPLLPDSVLHFIRGRSPGKGLPWIHDSDWCLVFFLGPATHQLRYPEEITGHRLEGSLTERGPKHCSAPPHTGQRRQLTPLHYLLTPSDCSGL